MKKIYFLLIALISFGHVNSQNILFSSSKGFKDILVYNTNVNSNIAKDINGNNIKVDANSDGEIQVSEALNVYQLNIDDFDSRDGFSDYTTLNGIEFFTNLTYLNCRSITVKYLNVTQLKNLEELNCDDNYMESLNVTGLKNLKKLSCQKTNFDTIDLTGLTNLEYLDCSQGIKSTLDLSPCINLKNLKLDGTSLTSLSVNGLNKLESLFIYGMALTNLSLTNLPKLKVITCGSLGQNSDYSHISKLNLSGLNDLEELYCSYNEIKDLDLSSCNKLKKLKCNNNSLQGILDLSDKKSLVYLDCHYNNLTGLLLKNGYKWANLDIAFYSNINLKYLCIENDQYNFFKNVVQGSGMSLSTVEINSYCTFRPGGTSYEIKGIATVDSNENGCDLLDNVYRNMKYDIQATSTAENVISDETGSLSIFVKENTYTITPVIENPDYFTVSPTVGLVTFPSQTSPFVQNFCLTPNGVHSDLEVTLLPLEPARPGFNAKYKIIYKNKGNTMSSGNITLSFNDDILDFNSATVPVSSQIENNLVWNFSSLKPFEKEEIIFTLKVNKPTDNPAVNIDDTFNLKLTVASQEKDETPADNTFTLNQTVVGSYDPNDKTCLEGSVIDSGLKGQYVNYLIRFENTGTYAAQNIVVKDMIDLDKFDISSLIPTSSSHSFVTKISEGNKVEFIFENINLPFYDANNDGYVAFKIKVKPSLNVGESFTNEANIYFDYNYPILTNKATSTFKTLGTQDFDFSKYFVLYPNPSDQVLNISQNQNIEIRSFEIFDILGQLVIAVPNAKTTSNIDVSKLKSGNYFIKVKSDKGNSSIKFIKI